MTVGHYQEDYIRLPIVAVVEAAVLVVVRAVLVVVRVFLVVVEAVLVEVVVTVVVLEETIVAIEVVVFFPLILGETVAVVVVLLLGVTLAPPDELHPAIPPAYSVDRPSSSIRWR